MSTTEILDSIKKGLLTTLGLGCPVIDTYSDLRDSVKDKLIAPKSKSYSSITSLGRKSFIEIHRLIKNGFAS